MSVDVICLGELLIDFVSLNRDVSLVESSGFKKAPGGAPANVAAGLAKLGINAGFIGKVGEDPFGYYLKKVLDDNGVDTSYLVFDSHARTTLSFVAQKSNGVRDCMFYRNPGADMLLQPEEIYEDYFKTASVFHFGSISLGSEKSRSATLKALEYGKRYNLIISYDPNLRPSLWDDAKTAKEWINIGFEHADIVKISNEEYEFITDAKTVEDCACYILNKGVKLVIITLGEKGCYYNDGVKSGYINGFNVNVLETTGAGDAFVAGVLRNIAKRARNGCKDVLMIDSEMIDALVFANAAGAISTTKMGAIPSLPDEQEVKRFLKSEVVL